MQQDEQILAEKPWISLETAPDVEAWMDLHDRELRRALNEKVAQGHGICFRLALGGEIYMHTNSDGEILLDVSEEAAWASPLICAATRAEAAPGQIWVLPASTMLALMLGLNSLIATSRLVLSHRFGRSR